MEFRFIGHVDMDRKETQVCRVSQVNNELGYV